MTNINTVSNNSKPENASPHQPSALHLRRSEDLARGPCLRLRRGAAPAATTRWRREPADRAGTPAPGFRGAEGRACPSAGPQSGPRSSGSGSARGRGRPAPVRRRKPPFWRGTCAPFCKPSVRPAVSGLGQERPHPDDPKTHQVKKMKDDEPPIRAGLRGHFPLERARRALLKSTR